jgi:hypothetical protein
LCLIRHAEIQEVGVGRKEVPAIDELFPLMSVDHFVRKLERFFEADAQADSVY